MAMIWRVERIGYRLALGTAGLAIFGFLLSFVVFAPQVRSQEAQAARLATAALSLDRALGFGGLIHNFKNHLLRPDERGYREAVLKNVATARQQIAILRDLAGQIGADLRLGETVEMLNAYEAKVMDIRPLYAQGYSMAQVDRAVRIDDRGAMTDLEAAVGVVAQQLALAHARAAAVSRNALWLSVMFLALTLLATSVAVFDDRRRQAHDRSRSRQVNRDLEDMTRIATHGIRSPLRQIGYLVDEVMTDLANRRAGGDTAIMQDLALIADRTKRLDALVSETLGALRETDFAGRPEAVDIAALLSEIAATEAPPGSDVVHDGDPTVVADRQLLTIALRSLVSNAVEHSDKTNLCLRVESRTMGNAYEVSVDDNGPGIAMENRDRIFGLFETLKGGGDGAIAGVGLAMVRRILRSMDGEVSVGDSTLGGASFRLTWPRMSFP
ncbi:MAG: HAMP domain-containing sensor histidine kinase [Pseudomonadota bacterium]